jgi:hypothetical protein
MRMMFDHCTLTLVPARAYALSSGGCGFAPPIVVNSAPVRKGISNTCESRRQHVGDGMPGEVVGIVKLPLDALRAEDVVAAYVTGRVSVVVRRWLLRAGSTNLAPSTVTLHTALWAAARPVRRPVASTDFIFIKMRVV